jgi:hypothetical protein
VRNWYCFIDNAVWFREFSIETLEAGRGGKVIREEKKNGFKQRCLALCADWVPVLGHGIEGACLLQL